MRLDGRWEAVAELDPGDERAHLALMRRHAANGDRPAALRQFDRLDRAGRGGLPGGRVIRPGGQPGRIVVVGSIGGGGCLAQHVPEPDPVPGLQHVPGADADRVPVLDAAVSVLVLVLASGHGSVGVLAVDLGLVGFGPRDHIPGRPST